MLAALRTEGQRFCSFPDEPFIRDTSVLFTRTADIGKLAVRRPIPGVSDLSCRPTYGTSCASIARNLPGDLPKISTERRSSRFPA